MRILKKLNTDVSVENTNRTLQSVTDDEGYLYSGLLFSDSPAIDAFGRLRISNPFTLFDSKQIFKDPDLNDNEENFPLFFDNQEVSGTGSATLFNINTASTTLRVSNVTASNRIRQTKMRFNYQPGKSIITFYTFFLSSALTSGITRRIGYFDDNNGLFFEDDGETYNFVKRSYITGSPVDTKIPQSKWNIDTFDGNGSSGITLDFTKVQILIIDFEWLGVGRVRFGFMIGGVIKYAHELLHVNNQSNVYMSTPNLPIRTQIINSGSGEASSISQICASIISEGGTDDLGVIRYASTGGNHVLAADTNIIYALIGIRLKSNYISNIIKVLSTYTQIHTASSKVEWMLKFNPQVAGDFNYIDLPHSAIQFATGSVLNTVTGGYNFAGGFTESGGQPAGAAGSVGKEVGNAIRLGTTIEGVKDTLVLCVRPIHFSTDVYSEGAITWRELS